MKLKLAENTPSYPILRLVSAGGKWEMGIAPAYCGVIVGCTHHLDADTHFYNFFHCQSSGLRLMEATAAVAAILSTLPEDASSENVLEVFPLWKNLPLALERERIAALRIAVSELRSPIVPIDDPDDELLARLEEICNNVCLVSLKNNRRINIVTWYSIDTAPKDGTEILGYSSIDGIVLVCWKSSGWEYSWGYSNLEPKLTHWMPLPSPPME